MGWSVCGGLCGSVPAAITSAARRPKRPTVPCPRCASISTSAPAARRSSLIETHTRGPLPKAESLHFPGRGLRQLVDELHPAGTLVAGQPLADKLLQFDSKLRVSLHSRAQDHICDRFDEAVVILPAGDTAFEDRRMLDE